MINSSRRTRTQGDHLSAEAPLLSSGLGTVLTVLDTGAECIYNSSQALIAQLVRAGDS